MNIEIKNLSKKTEKNFILKDINISFIPGSCNILIGPNGAGKTTLLRIIGLLDIPTDGEIFFDGKSYRNFTYKEKINLRRKIGFAFQIPIILNGTVFDNVIFGSKFSGKKIEKEKIENAISLVGLLNKINEDAKKLSGGEKQLLQLARILVLNPDVLLLDEPTSNLDPISTKKIEDIIFEFIKLKKTLIISTHNLLQAYQLGEKIFFLKDGSLIQEGKSKDIFETPSSLDIAEFSLSKNIIFGEIIKEGKDTYLLADGIKIYIVDNRAQGKVAAIIRPEEILISKTPVISSARNCISGKVKEIKNLGMVYSVEVICNKISLTSFITKQSLISMDLKQDDNVYLIFKATSVYTLGVAGK